MICKVKEGNLDLNTLEDDSLVVLVRDKQAREAERILVARHFDWCQRFVRRLAFGAGLSHEDTEDACQDAVFAIVKSIKRFDPEKDCRFKTFLHRVVSNRFKDFTRRQRRMAMNHRRWTMQTTSEQSELGRFSPAELNPVYTTQLRETIGKFSRFMDELEETHSEFLRQLISGTPLRAAGDNVGLSYDKAKRLRRKLKKQLDVMFS